MFGKIKFITTQSSSPSQNIRFAMETGIKSKEIQQIGLIQKSHPTLKKYVYRFIKVTHVWLFVVTCLRINNESGIPMLKPRKSLWKIPFENGLVVSFNLEYIPVCAWTIVRVFYQLHFGGNFMNHHVITKKTWDKVLWIAWIFLSFGWLLSCGEENVYFDENTNGITNKALSQPLLFDDFSNGLGKWTETGEGDWNTETLHSTNGYPASGSGSPAAHVDNCYTECTLTSPEIDLRNLDNAKIEFLRFIDYNLDYTDYFRVEVYNGSSWVRIYSWYGGNGDDNTWRAESYNLNSYLGIPNFKVRFVVRASDPYEHVHVDDVIITGEHHTTANPSWRIQALIYTNTDFSFVDSNGIQRRIVGALTAQEQDIAENTVRRFVAEQIPQLSSGMQVPTVDVVRITPAITKLDTYSGCSDGFWLSYENARPEISPEYDSVMTFWKSIGIDQYTGDQINLTCAAGLTPNQGTGQMYSNLQVNYYDTSYFENALKHEWGHGITFYHDALGVAAKPAVDNHAIADYVQCGTNQPYNNTDDLSIPGSNYYPTSGFTHDYYSGEIALASNPSVCLGIGQNAWASGGPYTKNLGDPLYIANPQFESTAGLPPMPTDWTTEQWGNPTYAADSNVFYSGNYSGRISASNSVDGRFVQTVAVNPDTLYRLEGYIRTDNVVIDSPGNVGANLTVVVGGNYMYSRVSLSGTNDWTRVWVDFNSGTQTSIQLEARLGHFSSTCTGTAWFDDISLRPALTP